MRAVDFPTIHACQGCSADVLQQIFSNRLPLDMSDIVEIECALKCLLCFLNLLHPLCFLKKEKTEHLYLQQCFFICDTLN